MKIIAKALLLGTTLSMLSLSSEGSAYAQDFSACSDHFIEGVSPQITRAAMTRETFPLCFRAFAVLYSGLSFTPLWSAEHLTAEHVDDAGSVPRVNAFHPEGSVPEEFRSELRDYSHTGYDKGHLTPSGDAWNAQSQQETFTLANMIPQNPDDNQNLWEGIEHSVRELASEEGELYIVTGPAFTKNLRVGRLLVPTMIFKAVYAPSLHKAAAYLVANGPGHAWTQVPISYLVSLSGVNPFPGLPDSETENELALPWPRPHGSRHGIGPGQVSPDNGGVPDTGRQTRGKNTSSPSDTASPSEVTQSRNEEKFGALLILSDIFKSEAKKIMLHLGSSITDYISKHSEQGPSHERQE